VELQATRRNSCMEPRSLVIFGLVGTLTFLAGRASSPGADAVLPVASLASTPTVALDESTESCGNFPWHQCGGMGFKGDSCCPDASECVSHGADFSQCIPQCKQPQWTQCGGKDYKGNTCCPLGTSCIRRTDDFSQCVPTCIKDLWTQCGGDGFSGDTCCPVASSCVVRTEKVHARWTQHPSQAPRFTTAPPIVLRPSLTA
jgi:hypothetical protein